MFFGDDVDVFNFRKAEAGTGWFGHWGCGGQPGLLPAVLFEHVDWDKANQIKSGGIFHSWWQRCLQNRDGSRVDIHTSIEPTIRNKTMWYFDTSPFIRPYHALPYLTVPSHTMYLALHTPHKLDHSLVGPLETQTTRMTWVGRCLWHGWPNRISEKSQHLSDMNSLPSGKENKKWS